MHNRIIKTKKRRQKNSSDHTKARITPETRIPDDVLNIMLEYAGLDTLPGHAKSSLVPTMFNSVNKIKSRYLKKLMTAITTGDFDEVKFLVESHPSLLLEQLDATDYIETPSGHRVNNRTVYRTALAAEDTEIAAFIKAKLVSIAGIEEATLQEYEQFPVNWQVDEEKKWRKIFTKLNSLHRDMLKAEAADFPLMKNASPDISVNVHRPIVKTFHKFQLLLRSKLQEVSTTGRHFYPLLMLHAYQIYDQYHRENNMIKHGNQISTIYSLLCWEQVITTLENLYSANYAQAACDGFYQTELKLQRGQPQARMIIRDMDVNGICQLRSALFMRQNRGRVASEFSDFITIKYNILKKLAPGLEYANEKPKSFCAIM